MVYFLFTEETNQQPSDSSLFFTYGRVFVPADSLEAIHQLIENIRDEYGYYPNDEFKFTPSSKPEQVSYEQFKNAKKAVLEGCAKLNIKFSANLVLHQIAQNQTLVTLVSRGANTIIAAFNRFLDEENSTGVCIVDRLPFENGYQYLQEKFQTGLIYQQGSTQRLEHVHLFAASSIGASHAMSAIDIILGSFRYCVNERNKDIAPREIFPLIANMMWYRTIGNTIYLRDRGLIFRPMKIRHPEYQLAYDQLTEHLINLLTQKPPELERGQNANDC